MSLLENICAHCWIHSIREIGLENFTDALIHFKEDEKYSELLSVYTFDEKKVSEGLINDIANLLLDEKAIYSKSNNSLFITMSVDQVDNACKKVDPEESRLIHNMLTDYRAYNTMKNKVKEKSLV